MHLNSNEAQRICIITVLPYVLILNLTNAYLIDMMIYILQKSYKWAQDHQQIETHSICQQIDTLHLHNLILQTSNTIEAI